ncbi:hypothetical protein SISSUDRAFT_1067334 [Sistotremastrum suecicum HHB10207 ss-3]|uniref:Uncharacterized protein n=1 Tax=Sistotremastrum suecicum HHB10207 ss-3 TaxID=1314776 RepID=A0A165X8F5_9AGAM|nr:hypothetical protein SISSUDRAFT_1067334 [Sistotremastrum suecicum HHB10207 ss-3]
MFNFIITFLSFISSIPQRLLQWSNIPTTLCDLRVRLLRRLPVFPTNPFYSRNQHHDSLGITENFLVMTIGAEREDWESHSTNSIRGLLPQLRDEDVPYTVAPTLNKVDNCYIDRSPNFVDIIYPLVIYYPLNDFTHLYGTCLLPPARAGEIIPRLWEEDHFHHHLRYLGTIVGIPDPLEGTGDHRSGRLTLAVETNVFGLMEFRIVSWSHHWKFYIEEHPINWTNNSFDIRWLFPFIRLHIFFNNRLIVPIREYFLRRLWNPVRPSFIHLGSKISPYWSNFLMAFQAARNSTGKFIVYGLERVGKGLRHGLKIAGLKFLSVFPPPEDVPPGIPPYGHV